MTPLGDNWKHLTDLEAKRKRSLSEAERDFKQLRGSEIAKRHAQLKLECMQRRPDWFREAA